MNKTYLGYGVYVKIEPGLFGFITLTTSTGAEDTNTIVLEPDVVYALVRFIKQHAPEMLK